ncbi:MULTISPECIES: TetR/AcrR family transcriptional regulator [unclassified Mycolicibacterium]|uniref:TetR/AcrR family transcriptional regulator n=1 Tax=unclassified Mycolicibacterium TaxID=2636767 RepID=UPI0012DC5BFF|nr:MULTISPECIES: TetR/AcrR family transcriptional regulator [unclassified Mycolicibacterium]MUL85388.1 TetR/AcrR family transcriptional regulator [Mycolicibacterium sp. CBMA 329]MUL88848.1 TetR/AcrR family transcriptional regulator [Mycolicibacterium sp. CBMA 331]MUM01878.1 TetR/AcrR family transcriptional regulator [Mycolicibacterium sp. CBMA 334]MUM27605.1 TetR/AcrR family transcriptional regulator [Mycolicibacterium sp. CBMA 295]MUM40495.1 TetR/AcrR family transcriptional regulator [Mycolic
MKRAQVVRGYGGISAADRRTERRIKLLAAGRQIWGESGISEVTVRAVCTAAGLTSRYFYEQFPSRDALLFAISDDVRDQLLAALVAAGVDEPGTLTNKLRSALTAFLDIIAADPHIHRIATGDVSGVAGLAQHRTHILEMITTLIVQYAPAVLPAATPSPAELRRGARFMVGGVNQIIEAWLENPTESPEELAAECADLCVAVVRGITRSAD